MLSVIVFYYYIIFLFIQTVLARVWWFDYVVIVIVNLILIGFCTFCTKTVQIQKPIGSDVKKKKSLKRIQRYWKNDIFVHYKHFRLRK